ncbi:aminotransferase class V-fold PLP-dependent enzyme [Streptacidiphilus sp. PB12-B1b]|uniref:aminotransferase class V-fold PLP-dependent enzyme n=1 Tax=Streptacidiphilus sp. PB12-B1b TaxID=2705012 RepID=UPI001CDBBA20|nr:aminotransferase class V-fold PLP-dependent enzyme [Streptacidiphilus sp. PB12-B1b]
MVETTTGLLTQSSHGTSRTVDELMRQELRARQAAARLLGLNAASADLERVALLPNTSTGLFHAALGLPRGEVLVPGQEFPSNLYPWRRAAALGRVQPVPLAADRLGRITPDLVRSALTRETVAVSVSAVDYRTGFRADLGGIREVIGADRLLVVDAIQGMGATELPWTAADLLVTGGQKWLRAGWSTGFLYASAAALERLQPVLTGWTGVADAGVFDGREHPPAQGAQRFSVTNANPVAAGGLARALELVERVGMRRIAAHIAQRTDELVDTVRSTGGTVLSPTAEHERAGIVSFALPKTDPALVGAALERHGVTATVRADRIRLCAHASTTLATVDLVHSALRSLQRG